MGERMTKADDEVEEALEALEKVKERIWAECKRDPAFRKEWEHIMNNMTELYEEMRKEAPYTDGELKRRDPIAQEKAKKLKELEKLLGHMKDAHRG